MAAENAISLSRKGVMQLVQDQWLQRLAKFVETYPTAEDTPEAHAISAWYRSSSTKIDAKKWYNADQAVPQ